MPYSIIIFLFWGGLSYLIYFGLRVPRTLLNITCAVCLAFACLSKLLSKVCVCVCVSAFVVASISYHMQLTPATCVKKKHDSLRKKVISLGSHRIAREFLELLQIHRIPSELNAFLRETHRIWNKDAGRFPKESLSHNMGRPGAAPGAARGAARGGQGQPGQPGGHAWPPQAKAGPRRSKMPKDSHACHPKRPDPPPAAQAGPERRPGPGGGGIIEK